MSLTDLDIAALRPRQDTAAAIRESLDLIEARRAAIQRHSESIAETQRAKLLSGTEAELDALDREAARCARALTRLDALQGDVQPHLDVAVSKEAVVQAFAAREHVAALCDSFVTRWRSEYPKLAQAIADILSIEAEVWAERSKAQQFEKLHAEALEGLDLPPWKAPGDEFGGPKLTELERARLRMGEHVFLPNVQGQVHNSPSLPPAYWVGRLK